MKISRNGIELIKSFEAFRAKKYLCPAGKGTIGYGHLLKRGEIIEEISKLEANRILRRDINIVEKSIQRNVRVNLVQNQFDALCSFVFNVGRASFQRSTLRQKINYEASSEEIYDEFMRWIYVGGIKSKGLINRRKIESNLFLSNYI